MTTVLADWHYAPTDWARENLLRAGVVPKTITVTGNPVTDAFIGSPVGSTTRPTSSPACNRARG